MLYVDLRMFGEAWAYQCELSYSPGEFKTCRVLEVTYTRWQGLVKLMIYSEVHLWDKNYLFNH